MIPRILSIAAPLFVYISLGLLVWALWQERRKLEWRLPLLLAAGGVLASFGLLDPIHRLFFDEDIYINIANNLTKAPVAQLTLLGGPEEIAVSTYYKEPSGWPAILSLVFLVTGTSEDVAFAVARLFYGLAIAAVYLLARELYEKRLQAAVAAGIFAATPICFWFSVSAGTDLPAALFSTIGLWGLVAGNGALAAAGLAMASQVRLELIVLAPLIWLNREISLRWKTIAVGLVAAQVAHVLWVLSVAPVLAEAEKVQSAFGLGNVVGNAIANAKHLFNPMVFPAAALVFALIALLKKRGLIDPLRATRAEGGRGSLSPRLILSLSIATLLTVYLLFYAGSFDLNPRYSIQLLAPIAVLAASVRRSVLILPTLILPYLQPYDMGSYIQTLAADHRFALQFVAQLAPADLIVSTEPEMFMSQGMRSMSAVFASERPERLKEEILKEGRVFYHSGARTNVADTEAWRVDRWLKSNFELQLIDSREYSGMRIAYYEILLNGLNREAR